MRKSFQIIFMAALWFLLLPSLAKEVCALSATQSVSEVQGITREELKSLLNDSNTIIIDVRHDGDWQQSDRKIKGAVHEDPMKEEELWAGKYPKDKNIVLYCA